MNPTGESTSWLQIQKRIRSIGCAMDDLIDSGLEAGAADQGIEFRKTCNDVVRTDLLLGSPRDMD